MTPQKYAIKKSTKRLCLAVYTFIIIYFMFFGFGRTEKADFYGFSLSLIPIPLWLPRHFSPDIIKLWIFSLGNLAAFIPFGVLIPINLKKSQKPFLRSLFIFITSITLLELLQMISLLGSFDMADIAVNTLGFLVGYGSFKICGTVDLAAKKLSVFCLCCLFLTLLSILAAQMLNLCLNNLNL